MIKFKIHIRMAEKRLSQKTVSQYVGITPTVMGKYFHGTITRINPEHLILINFVNYLTANQTIYLSISQMKPKNSLIFQ